MIDIQKQFKEKYSEKEYELFTKAYEFAAEHHSGQLRASGEPYITHPLAVAQIVMDLGMDADSVIASILHDTVEDCNDVGIDLILEQFGADIAKLVDGVTKLSISGKHTKLTEKTEQNENLRKLFLAIASDVRVVIIKLADRLHNMRTLNFCNEFKQQRISKETLEIYAPLAHRFGMGAIKGEMEDLCFRYLMPREYDNVQKSFNENKEEREKVLENAMKDIEIKLREYGINCIISGRPKHLYSIYRKMARSNCSIHEVYDLIAIRIIVDTINDCYAALGIVHANWRPLPGRFKDYIASPKPNMYRSLHTTVIGENTIPFEVQIRTKEMHRTAEYGIAAHWLYKEGKSIPSDLDRKTSWLRQILEAKETTEDSAEFVENILKDFLGEYVFVVSPKGEIYDLPKGSTPLDFAYRIHTNIGNHCTGAKINGNIVKLDYKLHTNDIVEIITSNTQPGPKLDWLKIVKTQSARNKIRQWFKKENRTDNVNIGKDLMQEAFKHSNYTPAQIIVPDVCEPVLQRMNMSNMDDLYASIGYGGISASQALHKLESQYVKIERKNQDVKESFDKLVKKQGAVNPSAINGVKVNGEEGMVVRFGNCCCPIPCDPIIGYITRGRGVSVHKNDCPNIQSLLKDTDRLIEVEWSTDTSNSFFATVQVVVENKPGALLSVSALLSGMNINVQEMSGKPDDNGTYTIEMTFIVKDSFQLDSIIDDIKKLKVVLAVYRWNKAR